MKTLRAEYDEVRESMRQCKPRSERKVKLNTRLCDLMLRRLRAEVRTKRPA